MGQALSTEEDGWLSWCTKRDESPRSAQREPGTAGAPETSRELKRTLEAMDAASVSISPQRAAQLRDLRERLLILGDVPYYLGSKSLAEQQDVLQYLRITRVINCAGGKATNTFEKLGVGVQYTTYTLGDNSREEIIDYFYDFFETVTNELKDQSRSVMVHCFQGTARSTAMTLAFIMLKMHVSHREAERIFERSRRKLTGMYPGFTAQLLQLQRRAGLGVPRYELPLLYRIAPHSVLYPALACKMCMQPDRNPVTLQGTSYLDTRGVFILHAPRHVFVWIGSDVADEPAMVAYAQKAVGWLQRFEGAPGRVTTLRGSTAPKPGARVEEADPWFRFGFELRCPRLDGRGDPRHSLSDTYDAEYSVPPFAGIEPEETARGMPDDEVEGHSGVDGEHKEEVEEVLVHSWRVDKSPMGWLREFEFDANEMHTNGLYLLQPKYATVDAMRAFVWVGAGHLVRLEHEHGADGVEPVLRQLAKQKVAFMDITVVYEGSEPPEFAGVRDAMVAAQPLEE